MTTKTTKTDQEWRKQDAAKRAARIQEIVEAGRAKGHAMTFAQRVAASYAQVAKAGR